ncbi:hypothetical protein BC835DRAFT_1305241 [Cytidiella melzeri]|nr:hypothetical protein BC835DRAFT_1305241 [Cytidiella melzeri]
MKAAHTPLTYSQVEETPLLPEFKVKWTQSLAPTREKDVPRFSELTDALVLDNNMVRPQRRHPLELKFSSAPSSHRDESGSHVKLSRGCRQELVSAHRYAKESCSSLHTQSVTVRILSGHATEVDEWRSTRHERNAQSEEGGELELHIEQVRRLGLSVVLPDPLTLSTCSSFACLHKPLPTGPWLTNARVERQTTTASSYSRYLMKPVLLRRIQAPARRLGTSTIVVVSFTQIRHHDQAQKPESHG